MSAMKHLFFVYTFLIIFLTGLIYADELSLGRQAESQGKLRTALTHYVKALQSVSEGSSKDMELRKKIIKIARKLQPPPIVPEEARRHMVRGRAAVKAAKDEDGFSRAADEYKKALDIAPWLVDIYYDLGVLLDRSGQYKRAIDSLNIYISSSPADAQAVRDLTYEIEYRAEEAQRPKTVKKKQEYAEPESDLKMLEGIWRQFTGNGTYNEYAHARTEVVGNDLLWITVYDTTKWGKRLGEESTRYRIKKKGQKIVGKTIKYDSALATQELEINVISYDEIKITEWHKHISPPKITFTYHKCGNTSLWSCGP